MYLNLKLPTHLSRLKYKKGRHKLQLQLLFIVCILRLSQDATLAQVVEWCYERGICGPATWGGDCSSGSRQSPISIPLAKLTTKQGSTRIILNKNYALPKLFSIKNLGESWEESFKNLQDRLFLSTGHGLQLQLNSEETSKCYLKGDGLGKDPYFFSQLHFHWGPNNQLGSEHRIDGKAFPLEMHMVHKGLKDPSRIAVLAILFYLSPNDNPYLNTILKLFGKVRQPETSAKSTDSITLTNLFPKKMRMFRYFGSLTTPPCSETVIWTVFRDPVPVSKTQMAKFRQLLSRQNTPITRNFRPLQATFTKTRKHIYSVRQLKQTGHGGIIFWGHGGHASEPEEYQEEEYQYNEDPYSYNSYGQQTQWEGGEQNNWYSGQGYYGPGADTEWATR